MLKNQTLVCIASLVLALLSSGVHGRAQCTDPTPPRTGFVPKYVTDRPITYSDGYKTLANVLYPDATPPSCGWPLLIMVHGLSGSRSTGSLEAYALVSQGFFVVTYDVRGQGDARALNPGRPSKLWSLDEWIDLAEVIEWAGTQYVGQVDLGRVGVFGDSQGAVHAWAAAAWSGKALPTNARRTKAFPEIDCVVPRYFDPHVVDAFVPGGNAFLYYLAGFGYQSPNPTVDLDPAFRAQITSAIDQNDGATLAAYLRSIPGVDFVSLLEQTTVPILAFAGWQDTWSDPRGVIELLDKLPTTTPHRCYLTTGPHGMPLNANQVARQIFLTEAWMKRWLKGSIEPVELGPGYDVAQMPSNDAEYGSPISLWRHRAYSDWPPASATTERLYLRELSGLTPSQPGATEGDSTVQNTVAANYGPSEFVADKGELAKVELQIPRSTSSFTTAAFAADIEYACIPKFSLFVEGASKDVLLGARLIVVDGTTERVLASGGIAVEFVTVPSSQRVDFELSPVATLVKKGQKLRIEIGNYDVQTPDRIGGAVFRRIPCFASFTAHVKHNASQLSWVELATLPMVPPSLESAETTISVTSPQAKTFTIRSSSEWKDALYVILLGFSGEGPAKVFPDGSELWFTPDDGTFAFVSAINLPMCANFAGVLDANGEATCTLNLGLLNGTIPLSLVGGNITIAPTFFTFTRGFQGGMTARLRWR
ncbi:MAG: hypothetical protein H6834_00880 [Planctomycetes bacterium]|nr:hypothetical protein [Planctomycetota bacterium]